MKKGYRIWIRWGGEPHKVKITLVEGKVIGYKVPIFGNINPFLGIQTYQHIDAFKQIIINQR
jgi:hypothetical protein